jgi:hypothetical protein
MALHNLENWRSTIDGLHLGARLLGVIQQLTQPPQPAYLELGLELTPRGLVSGVLPGVGQILLDFAAGSLVIATPRAPNKIFPLQGTTQAKVFEALFTDLSQTALAAQLPPGEDLFQRVSAGVSARGGRYKSLQKQRVMDEGPLAIDPEVARQYLKSLQVVFDGTARFRARLSGLQTPLVVWPDHFDLSMLWFSGHEIDESQPHLNFGFAPHSPGLDFPYLYAYAYPYPDRYQPPEMPEGAVWHTQGWTGAVLPLEVVAADLDPVHLIELDLRNIYSRLLVLLSG